MIRKTLSAKVLKKVHDSVDKILNNVKRRFIGYVHPNDKYMIFQAAPPKVSLSDLYFDSAKTHSTKGNPEVIDSLKKIASDYIEAQRAATKARVVHTIETFLTDADKKDVNFDKVLKTQLKDVFDQAKVGIKRVVETEATSARNTGALDGIVKLNAFVGQDDPVVYFIPVRDKDLCLECKRLHLMEDDVTPRLWRLSEVKTGYHIKGEDFPSVSGCHPLCRCTMNTMLSDFGFKNGRAAFIGIGFDALADQRK